jgi:heme exporter protein A
VNAPPAVQLTGVARRFARRWVLRGLDLTIHRNECVAVMGRNGSGKTTLLRVLSTLLRPSRGNGIVFGSDLLRDANEVREHVGLLAHQPGLYDQLTAAENLRFALRMMGQEANVARIDAVLDRVGLLHERKELVRGFSAGMRRRLALGRIMLRKTQLLLLDEPYAAFDADGIVLVNAFAREIVSAGGAAIIVTHDLERARTAVDRTVTIVDGRIT